MASIEAIIDFGEDENIEDGVFEQGKIIYFLFSFLIEISMLANIKLY